MEACLYSKRKESLNSKFQQLEGNSKIVSKDVTQSAVQNNSISFQIFQMQTCRVIVSEVKQYYLITAYSVRVRILSYECTCCQMQCCD